MADSYIGVFEFGAIVHTRNGSFSLGHDAVIVNVVGQQAGLYNVESRVVCDCWWRNGGGGKWIVRTGSYEVVTAKYRIVFRIGCRD